MNCDEALLSISAALDGELSPAERAKLSKHLLSCESCRELAEDLRVLNEELGRSDQPVPPELAESIRRAVAESEAPSAACSKKRRPPYLQAVAAMLALCVGLGGISLFTSRRMEDSAGGASPALYQAEPESADGSGSADEAESPLDKSSSITPAGLMEGSNSMTESSDGIDPTPQENGNGPTSDQGVEPGDSSAAAPRSTASLTPEEAMELVFRHLGGRGAYPDAELQLLDDSVSAYYLKTEETDQVSSAYYLDYYGLYEDGQSHWFRFYEDVSEKQPDIPGHEVTLNWYTVSPDGTVTAEFPE